MNPEKKKRIPKPKPSEATNLILDCLMPMLQIDAGLEGASDKEIKRVFLPIIERIRTDADEDRVTKYTWKDDPPADEPNRISDSDFFRELAKNSQALARLLASGHIGPQHKKYNEWIWAERALNTIKNATPIKVILTDNVVRYQYRANSFKWPFRHYVEGKIAEIILDSFAHEQGKPSNGNFFLGVCLNPKCKRFYLKKQSHQGLCSNACKTAIYRIRKASVTD